MTAETHPAESTQARREEELVAAVLASVDGTPDARLRQVVTALVRHLHAFLREVRPTQEEWQRDIDFLTPAPTLARQYRRTSGRMVSNT